MSGTILVYLKCYFFVVSFLVFMLVLEFYCWHLIVFSFMSLWGVRGNLRNRSHHGIIVKWSKPRRDRNQDSKKGGGDALCAKVMVFRGFVGWSGLASAGWSPSQSSDMCSPVNHTQPLQSWHLQRQLGHPP